MAPEILEGHEASVRSDVYSVGVLLYRLVTGSYPVQGRSVQEVRDKHARGERTFLRDARPDLPESFVQIVERALSLKPDVDTKVPARWRPHWPRRTISRARVPASGRPRSIGWST